MRQTRQRAAILTVLRQTESHPTADWVFQEARKILPTISLGTVYRTLEALSDEGMVRVHAFGERKRRYDGNTELHAHVICTACGQIEDVREPIRREFVSHIEKQTRYKVHGHRLEWYGLCQECVNSSQHANTRSPF